MSIFEAESWHPISGKEDEHDAAMANFLKWVAAHRDLFKEWKSLRYYEKYIAGANSGRFFIVWEYESLAAFEEYKKRRHDYSGPYAEYKKNDPYHLGVMDHSTMEVEIWHEAAREHWLE